MILSGSLGSSCVLSAELEGAVLDGFGDVLGADGLAAGQVRDGPGDLQHAVIAPRRHAERVERLLHEHGAVLVQLAESAQLRGLHIGVAARGAAGIAGGLDGPGRVDARFDGGGRLGLASCAQLLKFDGADLDDHVDAVEHGAGDAAEIPVDRGLRTGAPAAGVAVPPAGAGIHRAHEHELARERLRALHAGDGDLPVLERLAHGLGHKERNSLCMNILQREFLFIQYIQKSQPYGSLSCYNFHRVRGMKQIIFIFAMLMTCLSYAGKPEGRSERRTDMKPMKEIYLAGGCFWGTEHFLKQIEGVEATQVGYANGNIANPTYQQVCTGTTDFAETVKVQYDPDEVDLPFLIDLYFKTIDPTSLNKQGGDRGTQYRTGIYYTDTADLPVIRETVDRLAANYSRPLVVEIEPLKNFYLAEDYHQDYLDKNPGGYCHINPTLFDLARKAKMKKEGDGEYLNLEK